jgi:hypothetical protein
MTDDTTNTDTTNTDTDQTDADQTTRSFSPEYRAKMKDMDHTPPVEGANRTFERNNEQQPPKTDGGPREQRPDADETAEDSERGAESMKEMDHSSPVEGPTRVFERGNETSDVSK